MFGWLKNDDQLVPAAALVGVASSPQPTATSLAAIESLAIPRVQEVVFFVDFRCESCRRKVAKIMSKINDIQSVVINVLETKVTLVCTYSTSAKHIAKSAQQRSSWMRLFRYSCTA
ncbi:uncharacterized protein [Henckelia pumila]|uniref:uncharacterized protein isoform X2 n=1 Tax=Henckelia pumila TaxID=405737 RepID=UPI003C6E6129